MRHALSALVAIAIVVATAGCASAGGGGDGSTAAPQPSPSPSATVEPTLTAPLIPFLSPAVLELCPSIKASHLDADPDDVARAIVCTSNEISTIDGGSGTMATPLERASRVTGGLDELLAAYAEPNSSEPAEMCIELAADPLIVWLTIGGETIPVYAPVDGCGLPTAEASAAYGDLEFETLVEVGGPSDGSPADPGD